MNEIKVRRGDLFYVDLPQNKKNIQSGIRPCVVVSNDKANTFAPVIHVIPFFNNRYIYKKSLK